MASLCRSRYGPNRVKSRNPLMMLGRQADSVSDLTGTMPVFTRKSTMRRNMPSLMYGMTSSVQMR